MHLHPSISQVRTRTYSTLVSSLVSTAVALLLAYFLLPHQTSAGSYPSSKTTFAPSCDPSWQQVAVPRLREYNGFSDVDGLSPNDIWAVGDYHDFSQFNPNTSLIMHYDGTSWTAIPNDMFAGLTGVEALAPDDVWTVGSVSNGSDTETFAAHWDGTAWARVPTPTLEGGSFLMDIKAISPTDIWAVGYNYGFHSGIALHWNGFYWALVPSTPQSFGPNYRLNAVTAISSNDVWAVGYIEGTGETRLLFDHWDGNQWTATELLPTGWYYPEFYGIDAIASNDIWAIGIYSPDSGTTDKALYMHYDGTSWTHVDGELVGTFDLLYDVQAVNSHDIWAVGTQADCALCLFTHNFTMHYDGTSWTHVPIPDGGREVSGLGGITVISPADIWTVGVTSDYTTAERYSDATAFQLVCPTGSTPTGTPPTATPTRTNTPTAVPTACNTGTINYSIQSASGASIISSTNDIGLHCNECTATIQLPFSVRLYDQQYTSAIVGSNGTLGFVANSNTWRIACLPSQEFDYAILPYWQELDLESSGDGVYTSVEGIAPNRIFNIEWRGKDYFFTSNVNVELKLYENAPNGRFDIIYGTVPTGSNQQVTVGVQKGQGLTYTQYVCQNQSPLLTNGTILTFTQPACPTPPTATSTALPATSTPTSAPATSTSTSAPATFTTVSTFTPTSQPSTSTTTPLVSVTPTACTVTFSDVPADHTFYSYVMCLACNGIISGYPDNTFRPQNNVTRGQISKIVSISAGFADPNTSPLFQDVLPGNTFYSYVQALASRGYVSGYECGLQPNEPCGSENLRYFRPGEYANRGQVAKIVTLAAGYTEPHTNEQTFEDVPREIPGNPGTPAHPFHEYVERLSTRGVITGYECTNGPIDPCIPPLNRPYFHPGGGTTRGQLAKLVSRTFFPVCSTR